MTALAFLLLAAMGQPAAEAAAVPTPAERKRTGLWIADTAFAPADIASAEQGFDGETAQPNVVITFTEPGRVKFERLQQGRVEQQLEISVDGEIVFSPYLTEIITGNQLAISGTFTVDEAKALARRIAPVPRR
jgi:preprotein translocase subunit SecD